jgi:electron transport complex protein RnfE
MEVAQMSNKVSCKSVFFNGLIKENPTFVLTLGMCPTLAVTTSAINGLGMGLTTTAVLVLSNVIISLLRNIIPNRVRIPAFIVIVASFVTMVELLLEGFLPSLYSALGIYIPLIVVNCIILGRAESFASKNSVIPSFFDGLGMGLGFSLALTIIGAVRELLGAGELFGIPVINNILSLLPGNAEYVPISIFVLAPGAFFVLAALTATQNRIKRKLAAKGTNVDKIQSGCTSDCSSCGDSGCSRRFIDINGEPGSVAKANNNLKKEE